ncbi:NUDIX domain-containing protein [Clostridium cavendishii DSM 21758]|uniref:NUDIX domain-containing protein n=1 Tax=Clostridium cavendishii DSM 21758 TaxID=1121302 RepID=A0A1M6SWT7_9CLOT|nr:NUDIX domain-containing protein [Clostridium cavendishii]SHK49185.1 NUDIX domain-containing protein [Clostridium cavendishii DSM 21758]
MSLNNRLNKDGLNEKEFFKNYSPSNYERPSLTVDMLLFTLGEREVKKINRLPEKELKVLLIKRKEHPFIGSYAIPGGFVGINESIEDAVYRELKEETDIGNVYLEQLYTWGDVNRDPRMRVVSTSYMALVNENNIKPKAGTDAEDVAWFSIKRQVVSSKELDDGRYINTYKITLLNEDKELTIEYLINEEIMKEGFNKRVKYEYNLLTEESIGFDHIKIINYALERIKNKVQYTPIAFSLLPELFTLTELQQVYEIILERSLIKPNFRRWVSKMVEETEETKKDGAYRPSKLFRLKNESIIEDLINI